MINKRIALYRDPETEQKWQGRKAYLQDKYSCLDLLTKDNIRRLHKDGEVDVTFYYTGFVLINDFKYIGADIHWTIVAYDRKYFTALDILRKHLFTNIDKMPPSYSFVKKKEGSFVTPHWHFLA